MGSESRVRRRIMSNILSDMAKNLYSYSAEKR